MKRNGTAVLVAVATAAATVACNTLIAWMTNNPGQWPPPPAIWAAAALAGLMAGLALLRPSTEEGVRSEELKR